MASRDDDGSRLGWIPEEGFGCEGRGVTVSGLWRGWFHCLEFVTPDVGADDVPADQAGSYAQ